MIGAKVVLTEIEQRVCKHIARSRYEFARKNNIIDAKKGTQDNEFTDENGFGGEMAFCKLFNLFPDFSIEFRSSKNGRDEKGDAILNGKIIDVKTTKYVSGRLTAATWKLSPEIDFFALMTGVLPAYTFRGFFSREETMQEKRLGDLGHGLLYVVEQKELYEKI